MQQPAFLRPSKNSRTWTRNALICCGVLISLILVVLWSKSISSEKISEITESISNQFSNISFLQPGEPQDDRSSQQCSAYSDGYRELDNTERYWKNVGGMNRTDIEKSRDVCQRHGECLIFKVYNGQLYIRIPIDGGM